MYIIYRWSVCRYSEPVVVVCLVVFLFLFVFVLFYLLLSLSLLLLLLLCVYCLFDGGYNCLILFVVVVVVVVVFVVFFFFWGGGLFCFVLTPRCPCTESDNAIYTTFRQLIGINTSRFVTATSPRWVTGGRRQ